MFYRQSNPAFKLIPSAVLPDDIHPKKYLDYSTFHVLNRKQWHEHFLKII